MRKAARQGFDHGDSSIAAGAWIATGAALLSLLRPRRLTMSRLKITLRVDFDSDHAIGPGKVALLEKMRDCGSLSQAARELDMSYRRAWQLLASLNQSLPRAAGPHEHRRHRRWRHHAHQVRRGHRDGVSATGKRNQHRADKYFTVPCSATVSPQGERTRRSITGTAALAGHGGGQASASRLMELRSRLKSPAFELRVTVRKVFFKRGGSCITFFPRAPRSSSHPQSWRKAGCDAMSDTACWLRIAGPMQ